MLFFIRRSLLISVLLFPFLASAQELLQESKDIRAAYTELMREEKATVLQIRFIETFPGDKETFMNVFNPPSFGQLTKEGPVYVQKFCDLGDLHTKAILSKSLAIAKGLISTFGVTECLQSTIYKLYLKEPEFFIAQLNQMKKKELEDLGAFLHYHNEEQFEKLCYDLAKNNEKKIFNAFKKATKE